MSTSNVNMSETSRDPEAVAIEYNLEERVTNAVTLAQRSAEAAEGFLGRAREAATEAERAFLLGMAAHEAKDYNSAREYLVRSFELEPDHLTAARLGVVGYHQQDWYFAEEWLQKALADAPDGTLTAPVLGFEMAYASLFALIQAHLGRPDEAIARASEVIDRRPDVMAYRARATALLIQGDVNNAVADLKRARAAAPSSLVNELAADVELVERVRAAELSGMPVIGEISMLGWPV